MYICGSTNFLNTKCKAGASRRSRLTCSRAATVLESVTRTAAARRFKLRLPGRAGMAALRRRVSVPACFEVQVTVKAIPDPSHDARSESRCLTRVTMPDQSQGPELTLSKTSPSTSTVGCFESHCRLATSLRRGTSVAAGSSCSLRRLPGNQRLSEQTRMLLTKPCGEQLAVWDSHPSQGPADLGYDSDGTAGLPPATVGPGSASEQPVH